jgi:Spy/CpxP family protein refolding chaperone
MPNTKTGREAAFLVIVVFLLGALLGGVGNHVWDQRVQGQQQSGPKSRDQVVADFTHELDLTPDQQKQLATIVDDTRAKWRALYAPLDAQHEDIRQQGRARIRAILTPAQLPKFEDFVQRLDEQRKKDQAAAR